MLIASAIPLIANYSRCSVINFKLKFTKVTNLIVIRIIITHQRSLWILGLLVTYLYAIQAERKMGHLFLLVLIAWKKFRALVASEWTWSCELWDRVERLDSIGGGRWMLLSIEEGQREAQGAEGRGRRVNENGTIAPLSRLSCRNNTVSVHQYQYSLSPPSPSPNSILFLALGN